MITSHESRNEGIELLRIFAMAMIVAVHFSVSHRDIYSGNQAADFVNGYLYFSVVGGVDIFAIVSGWVMCQRIPRPIRLLKIWVQCLFYNIIIFLSIQYDLLGIFMDKNIIFYSANIS